MNKKASEPPGRNVKIQPRVVARETVLKTPWFEVVAKTLDGDQGGDPYYAVVPDDYVAILALTPQGHILLVRQYRPVTETVSLELPCGLVDTGETPEAAAKRELMEETGYRAETLELLGNLVPDAGRLGNRMWCYFAATTVPVKPLQPSEPELEALTMAPEEVARRLADGGFENAPVYAIFMLAQVKGRLILPAVK
jgi:ADP-ribose pyrophosphatase